MLEIGLGILLCLLLVISIVTFGVMVVKLIIVELKEYRNEKSKDQRSVQNE